MRGAGRPVPAGRCAVNPAGEIVVVGAGPAGHRLVERLHRHGYPGPMRLLGAELEPPYNRMLLPSVLERSLPAPALALPPLPRSVPVRWGSRVTRIDRPARVVYTSDGRAYPYHRLVLATGARPRIPRIPGLRDAGGRLAAGVRTVRTLASCRELPIGPVTVLGAGILGVEVALALRRRGREVTVVHRHPYPMERHLDAAAGELLLGHLRERGVSVRLSQRATGYGAGQLLLDGGTSVAAGTLLLCTGVRPDVALARAAGLAVGRGVVVDDRLRTSDPRIHAVGDCAQSGASVPTAGAAWEQADTLAELLCGGDARYRSPRPVVRLKDPELSAACLGGGPAVRAPAAGIEQVRLTDPARGRHAALSLRDGRITGAVLYGLPHAIAAATELYDRDLPLPTDRLAFLLGIPPGTDPVELPEDAVVCVCNTVTKGEIVQAWHRGCRDMAGLAAATRAGTGCGNCVSEVRRIWRTLSDRAPARSGAEAP